MTGERQGREPSIQGGVESTLLAVPTGDLAATQTPRSPPVEPVRPDRTAVVRTRGYAQSRLDVTGEETIVRHDMEFSGPATATADALDAVLSNGRVGRFVILRELGRGAMGVVLAAYDEELDRKVAIKLLHATRGHDASQGQAMLLREAQALARLAHPNVVAVHEVGVVEGAVFVAMEYVAGVDLQRWLADRPRPWREVVAVLRQAGLGLVAAHREGLVHRDFKPGNVLVGDDGRVRVADFGLAARRGAAGGRGDAPPTVSQMTATLAPDGTWVGTPLYMAPELFRGGPATAQSDQFAFCVALYEALFGVRPFEGDTLATVIDAVEGRALPATPPRAEVPAWLYAAVCRGLAKAPEQRFATLEELVELLGRDPEAERLQRRRRALQIVGAIAGTAAIVTLAVFAYGAMRRYASERQAEGRLTALRGEIEELRGRGEHDEAGRLLQSFVTLPDNRGLPVVARAYLEWAAAQQDDAAAVDAYASAYITARAAADERAALRGLVDRLSAQGRTAEAAAALTVLERAAPDEAAAPELQRVRLAAALWRRDLPAARAVLAAGDADGWAPVLGDLSQLTELSLAQFGGKLPDAGGAIAALEFDGEGGDEVVMWAGGSTLRVFRADAGLTPLPGVELGSPKWVSLFAAPTPGEPVLAASYPTAEPERYEQRLLRVGAGGAVETLDAWRDSFAAHGLTIDLDRDGRREVYLTTEAYARKFWRLDRSQDGTWSRRSAHGPTDAANSDLNAVVAADLEGDGQPELAVAAGPWNAYDLRVFKPLPGGRLDLIARRSFGAFKRTVALRGVPGGDLVAFVKTDFQVAPGRFPPDKPGGEPNGLYLVGLRGGAIEVLGFLPEGTGKGALARFGPLLAGDLDGDGQDELVVDLMGDGMLLLRWRPGEPLRPLVIAGVRPSLVHDLDGDRKAEILAQPIDPPERVVVLGAGAATLPPLPAVELAPRAVPLAIDDPAIATAWTNAEQMVAIGLPRRAADELSAIARLSGQVAPDMLLRTAEIFAGIGEDAAAAEHFVAAASRPDLAPQALAGAAAARRRLGEFAAAEALTRQRLALVEGPARADVEAELAALQRATATRPELTYSFARPLDPRWQIADPVAVRRALSRGELSVWTSPVQVLAELPLEWDGGPAALEVELELDRIEWGTELAIRLAPPDGPPWLRTGIRGVGLSERPDTILTISDGSEDAQHTIPAASPSIRTRIAVFPEFATVVFEADAGERRRVVAPIDRRSQQPSPGPLRLQVTSRLVEPGFVGHLWIRSIRLTGFTADAAAAGEASPAWLLADSEPAAALAALGATTPGSEAQLWRIDALLGLGRVDAASAEIRSLLAADPSGGPVYRRLYHRLRRGDAAAWLAARGSFGSRLIDLLLDPSVLSLRPGDIEVVLTDLPASDPAAAPEDPLELQRLVLIDYARGTALVRAGRLAAAREAFAAAFARVSAGGGFPQRDKLQTRLLRDQLAVAVAMADREGAMQWIRHTLDRTETPYLTLERMKSDAALVELVGAATWDALRAEIEATRP